MYREGPARPDDLVAVEILQGKELSYNNYLDIEAARRVARDLHSLDPARAHCTIVKHTIPCGAAVADTALEAYERALAADPVSAFGGIVALDQAVDGALAARIAEHFLEVVYAPAFDEEARATLAGKKNLRLLAGPFPEPDPAAIELRRVGAGSSSSGRTSHGFPKAIRGRRGRWRPRSGRPRSSGSTSCSRGRSAARWRRTRSCWRREARRSGSVAGRRTAWERSSWRCGTRELRHDPAGAALASDGFFPFPDAVEAAAAAGVGAIIQPGGSRRDEAVVAAAESARIPMVLTRMRQFRH